LPEEKPLPPVALIAAALSEMQVKTPAITANTSQGGDAYSPWNRADSFRMGE
jgi:hypothetical protein